MAKEKSCHQCSKIIQVLSFYDAGIGRLNFCSFTCKHNWAAQTNIGGYSYINQSFIRDITVRILPASLKQNIVDPGAEVIILVEANVLSFYTSFQKGVTRKTISYLFDIDNKKLIDKHGTLCDSINVNDMVDKIIEIVRNCA